MRQGRESEAHDESPGTKAWLVPMILEVAPLRVRAGHEPQFESAFLIAQGIIAGMPGHVSHELRRCVERPNEYVLLVRWESLAAHEVGFRKSPQYQEWKRVLHHFYEPFPVVLHYEAVAGASSAASIESYAAR